MAYKTICAIPHSNLAYDIDIAQGLLKDHANWSRILPKRASKVAIIGDDNVTALYGRPLLNTLSDTYEAHLFSFPAGEAYKTRQTKEYIENHLFEHSFGRDSVIIALGGGVSTDLAGYIAATYCRGVPLIMAPTSLLGMVDASFGGKNGVNVPQGKNLVGSLYQPKNVLIDPKALQTLPIKELRNGIVEMIKHALISDAAYFELLNSQAEAHLNIDLSMLEKSIHFSCIIKNGIVMEDAQELGKRHLLNFGHTIGHAIEHVTNYTLAHGTAVAIGMLVESYISTLLGHLSKTCFDKIYAILNKFNIPLYLSQPLSPTALFEAMVLDKKSLQRQPRFVLLDSIGSALPCNGSFCAHVDEKIIINAIEWMNNDLCGNQRPLPASS